MMGHQKAYPVWDSSVPARFAAVFDRAAGRWRGASLQVALGSLVLILSFAPPVKPGAFCDPKAVWERRAEAIRALMK